MNEKSLFPIQSQPTQDVPLWIADLIHKGYSLYHHQPLERIAERGGFGQNEAVLYLAEYAQHLERKLRKLAENGDSTAKRGTR